MQIIKVLQKVTMNRLNDLSFSGCELYQDVYQEIVIVKLLSNLHQTVCDGDGHEFQAHSFPRVFRTRIVHGDIPNYFLIRKYTESVVKVKPVERFEDVFGMPRESLVIVMKFGGDSLWDRMKSHSPEEAINSSQLLSVCFQLTLALAIAEVLYEFEHRDLHVCNVLVKPTKKKYLIFKLRSQDFKIKTFGIKAVIIDATFSRMAVGASVYYTDLTNRLKGTLANTNPDGQESAYQQMYQLIGDQWRGWFPESNLIWLKYFFNEILISEAFQADADESDVAELQRLIESIGDFRLVSDFSLSLSRPKDDIGAALHSVSQTGQSMSNLS